MDSTVKILWAKVKEVNEAADLAWASGQLNTAEDLKAEAIRLLERIQYGVSDTRQHNSGFDGDSD
jgi:hypothetical protein